MKAYLILFLLIPFFCPGQEDKTKAAAKPSTTDCPTWKKKDKKASKAEYFQYLRTAKPQSKTQTSYATNTDSKVQPNTVQQRTKRIEPKETSTPLIKEKDEATAIVNSPVEASQTNSSRKSRSVKREKEKTSKDLELTVKQEEQKAPVVAVSAAEEPGAKTSVEESVDKPKSETGEKLAEEKSKIRKKMTRLTRKTTKVRKHSNAKCPSF